MTMTYQQVKGMPRLKAVDKMIEVLKNFTTSDQKLMAKSNYFKKLTKDDLMKMDIKVLKDNLCLFQGVAPNVAAENQLKPAFKNAADDLEEPTVIPHEQLTSKNKLRAKLFPPVITNDKLTAAGIDKLFIQPDITIEQIIEHFKKGDRVFVAQYWTESHITQYNYYGDTQRPVTYKKFPNDLDLLMVEIITTEFPDEKGNVNLDDTNMLAMSIYTQGFFTVHAKCLKDVVDGIRYDNGCEFNIYLAEPVKEETPIVETPATEPPKEEPKVEKSKSQVQEPVNEAPQESETPPAEQPKEVEASKPKLSSSKKRDKK